MYECAYVWHQLLSTFPGLIKAEEMGGKIIKNDPIIVSCIRIHRYDRLIGDLGSL
jgi:hypothetical protein